MKKLFISLFAMGYILNITAAENVLTSKMESLGEKPHYFSMEDYLSKRSPKTRASEKDNLFGYCFDIDITQSNAFGIPSYVGGVMEGAIEIPKEIAERWKGAQVTGINIGFGKSPNKNVKVYVTKDLEGVPAVMQDGVIENEIAWNLISLDKPYTIDGDGFFIGYQSPLTSTDCYPLTVDFNPYASTYGDLVGITYEFSTGKVETVYEHLIGVGFGSVCLQAEINGTTVPNLAIAPLDLYLPNLAAINQPFDSFFSLENIGKTTLTDVEVECKVNGVLQNDLQVTLYGDLYTEGVKDVPFGRPGYVFISGLKSNAAGNVPVEITIKKITGEGGNTAVENQKVESEVFVAGKTYDKKLVVEEFTGTWCGNCPRGIVGMKYMEENYGDKGFIGIAVHYNDEMYVDSYWDVIQYYSQGAFPSAVMDRNYYFDPSKETLEEYYNQNIGIPAEAKVTLTAEYDEAKNVVKADATTEYGFTGNDMTYALAFVVTENNVGQYIQSNYFSGTNYDVGGWQNLGPNVPTLFDHVAKNIWFGFGIADSQPENIVEETPYPFSIELSMNNVKNVNDSEVIVLLINYTTGLIVNADKVKLGGAGVESLVAEPTDGIYKVYNLQGVKVLETKDTNNVNTLPAGIYIVNGKKVIL